MKAAAVKALRLLFVFAASVPEWVAAAGLATESAALPVVKSIGLLALFPARKIQHPKQSILDLGHLIFW